MTNKEQVIHKLGSPSVMQWETWHVPAPKLGEVRLRHTAITEVESHILGLFLTPLS
jgi:NADPH:quinone reductase-like Zn-dependent oxidoreductase